MAAVAQDVFRLRARLAPRRPPRAVSRVLFVDQVTAHRMDGPEVDRNDVRTVIEAIWHKASGGCLCHLHNRRSPAPFKRIELRLEVRHAAGQRQVRAPLRRGGDVPSVGHHGCCAKAFKAELWQHTTCRASRRAACACRSRASSRAWTRTRSRCAARRPRVLRRAADERAERRPAQGHQRGRAHRAAQLARLRKETSHTADDLENRDQACVFRCKGGVHLGPDGKLRESGRSQSTKRSYQRTDTCFASRW